MQLQEFPVQPKGLLERLLQFRPKPAVAKQVNLQLTIQFNEQWLPLSSGRVKFGLKAGELRLKLENGAISRDTRELNGSFEQEDQQAGRSSSTADLAVSTEAIATETVESPDKPRLSGYQVTTKGSEDRPTWVFQASGESVLKGLIKNAKLGTLDVNAKPCRVTATFEVSLRDVHLTDAEGLWPPDISPNKRIVLERMIALHLLKSKLNPYLSRAELRYD